MWQQAQDIVSLVLVELLIFLISQSDTSLHKFWRSENKQSFFFIKNQYFIFFLPIENNIIKSIGYEIIQNDQWTKNY